MIGVDTPERIAIGARVCTQERHSNAKKEIDISIPDTLLDNEYFGERIALNVVGMVLNQMGLGRAFDIKEWVLKPTA